MRDVTEEYRREIRDFSQREESLGNGSLPNLADHIFFYEFDNIRDIKTGTMELKEFPVMGLCQFDCRYSGNYVDNDYVEGIMRDFSEEINVSWLRCDSNLIDILGIKGNRELSGFVFSQNEIIDPRYPLSEVDYNLLHVFPKEDDRTNFPSTEPDLRKRFLYYLLAP